jgi:hypothetical protein
MECNAQTIIETAKRVEAIPGSRTIRLIFIASSELFHVNDCRRRRKISIEQRVPLSAANAVNLISHGTRPPRFVCPVLMIALAVFLCILPSSAQSQPTVSFTSATSSAVHPDTWTGTVSVTVPSSHVGTSVQVSLSDSPDGFISYAFTNFTVPRGSTVSRTVTFRTVQSVNSPTPVQLTARATWLTGNPPTMPHFVTATRTVTLRPPSLSSIVMTPTSIVGGTSRSFDTTLTLNGAPLPGEIVSVSSDNPSLVNVVGSGQIVPSGEQTTALVTLSSAQVTAHQQASVSFGYLGSTRSVSLSVTVNTNSPVTPPTVRVAIERSTNRFVVVTWGPPQATLQCSSPITGTFADVPGATSPYRVDTRLAPARGYRACLLVDRTNVFIWQDTVRQPGKVVLDWFPREWRLQESATFAQWQDIPSTPPTDWYYPPTPLESPAVPGGVFAGARIYRNVPTAGVAAAQGPVFSVSYFGYANLVFQVGQSNYFSLPLQHPDRNLNTLLPLPPEANGTTLYFYDSEAQDFGPPFVFDGDGGWVSVAGAPALKPSGESAGVIFPQSSTPGATTVVSTMVGEISSGRYQRTLPPGYSLNGPLVPLRGGITTVHNLQANDDDLVLLFNTATRTFDAYGFFFGLWVLLEDLSLEEPVIGPGDAFFYVNNSGVPLDWNRTFDPGP